MKTTQTLLVGAAWIGMTALALAADTNRLQFSFGTTQPAPGYVLVAPAMNYRAATGFGFEPGAAVTARDHCVTGEQLFLFSVRLLPGNYRVTMRLGDEGGESVTTVKAEARRLMLENVRTGKGEVLTREITVNVRYPRIADYDSVRLKQREKDTEMVTWDDKLTLEFNGARPCLRSLEIVPAPETPTVFLAGDSTVCDQPQEPWSSWGQMLPRFFKPGVAVANYAQSGESIKSSLAARRFEKIFSLMKPGDWLLVQFGHNDMKDKAPDALSAYRANLKRLVAQTREKGGTPVLVISMERKAGVKGPTLAGYPDVVREVAREDKVALIDLHAMSVVLYKALGTNLDRAFQDGTHHNNYGSYELAKCVAAGMVSANLDLAKYLVEEVKAFDPSHPDEVEKFNLPASPMRSTVKPEGN
jgi:lysophospholipase L1-like esterase